KATVNTATSTAVTRVRPEVAAGAAIVPGPLVGAATPRRRRPSRTASAKTQTSRGAAKTRSWSPSSACAARAGVRGRLCSSPSPVLVLVAKGIATTAATVRTTTGHAHRARIAGHTAMRTAPSTAMGRSTTTAWTMSGWRGVPILLVLTRRPAALAVLPVEDQVGADSEAAHRRDGPPAAGETGSMSGLGDGHGGRAGRRVEGGERWGAEALDGQVHADAEMKHTQTQARTE